MQIDHEPTTPVPDLDMQWRPAVPESELPEAGSFATLELDGESVLVVRGRDLDIRAFYNVCRHRGTAVEERPCGKAVRFQCPYHAWIYDLEGRLVRAKHTDDLEVFTKEASGLREIPSAIRDGLVMVALADEHAAPVPTVAAPSPGAASSLLSAEEIAAVRRPYRAASLLPGRAYHKEAFWDHEVAQFFGHDWLVAGRLEDLEGVDGIDITLATRRIRVVRDADGHPSALEPEGARVASWQGFVFVSLAGQGPPLFEQLGDLVERLSPLNLGQLRVGARLDYDVAANWKLLGENYSECYHCPGLHPQLNHLTPYNEGGDWEPLAGAWQGGWMNLVRGAETLSSDGKRHGRPLLPGLPEEDACRVGYYVVWPTTFLSLHPDYLLVHRLLPDRSDRTRVVCELLVDPRVAAQPGFTLDDAVAFWDTTNRQDWHVCELQQRGTASRSWTAGRYATNEPSVQAFDAMIVDRYADDGVVSRRTVRGRYDMPPPGPAE
jgi:phenylpropionate dioxygenase-like ring-hydroxylating dioxygenase large terminal subunit